MANARKLPEGPRVSLLTFGSVYGDLQNYLTREHSRYGDAFTVKLPMGPDIVVLSHPEQVKWVFENQDEFSVPPKKNPFTKLFGKRSCMVLNGSEHKDFRARTASLFSHLDSFGEKIVEMADQDLETIPSAVFSMYERLRTLTLRIIIAWLFGENRSSDFHDSVSRLSMHFARHPMLSLPPLQFRLGPLTPWAKFIALRREVMKKIDIEILSVGKGDHMTGKMIRAGFQGDDLRDNILTFLMAGHETSAGQGAWCFNYILRDRELMDRLRSELQNTDVASILANPLLDSVLHEVFRLRPVIPFISRICSRELRMGEYVFPKGTFLMLPVHLTHTHEAVYENALEFQPRRFLNRRPKSYEWYPFGAGTRGCPGRNFAFLELKIVIARYLTRKNWELDANQSAAPVRRGVTILPRDGVRVRMR